MMPADLIEHLLTSLAVRAHAFALCEIATGHRLAFSRVDSVTLHYVLAGRGTVRTLAAPDIAYEPNCMIVVPAGIAHSLGEADAVSEITTSAGACGLLTNGLLRFTAGDGTRDTLVVCATMTAIHGGALGLFQGLDVPLVQTSKAENGLTDIFAALVAEVIRPRIGTQAMVEVLMKQALIILLRHHLLHFRSGTSLFAALHDDRLMRVVAAVVEQPSFGWTVTMLAARAGMSRSGFAGHFMRAFKQTPMEFVQIVRLRLAADLLRATNLPVPMIATNVGYASRTYFSRVFKTEYGTTPAAYRSKARAGEVIAYGLPDHRTASVTNGKRDLLPGR